MKKYLITKLARKKASTPSKRFWTDNVSTASVINPAMIDPNIENISANVNRADSEKMSTQKLTADNYYSSDESNDSLVIDHDN